MNETENPNTECVMWLVEEAWSRRAVHQWLKGYDPDAHNGAGHVEMTTHVDQAHRFPDFAAAMACWKLVSSTHPIRLDGKPNRPLTAWTIQVISFDAAKAGRML